MSDLTHTLELSTQRMENIMNKVFLLNDFDGYTLSVHATMEQAEMFKSLRIEADTQHWFEVFGDYDGSFDNYYIVEWEVN